jgi:hypothetical protein
LIQKAADVPDGPELFAGVLHKLEDLGRLEAILTAELNQLQQRAVDIRQKVNLARPHEIVPDLMTALKQLRTIRDRATNEHAKFLLTQKEQDFAEATRLAAGLVLDVLAADETIIPGQEFNLTVSVINGGPYTFAPPSIDIALPAGWQATLLPPGAAGGGRGGRGGGQPVAEGGRGARGAAPAAGATPTAILPGQKYDQVYAVRVPSAADFTQPYWLRQPRKGDRFVWPAGSPANMPFDEPLLTTRATLVYDGAPIVISRPAEFRSVDRMLGEERAYVKVVPALSVALSPQIAVVPIDGSRQKEFTVTVENQNTGAVDGEARLIVPARWTVSPATQPVRFTRQGEKAALQFRVNAPATAGDFTVQAVVRFNNQEFRAGYTPVAYPHIETHHLYAPAESKVEVFDVRTRVTSVGYVEGVGDTVPDALRQLGIQVTMLTPQDLATGDLSKYPTVVLGIRAYQAREDVRAYNKRLLDYVAAGGNLIVQYNRSEDVGNVQYGPYPFTINNGDRVTNEDAPVMILDPGHPALNVPNKISAADFENWVQERGTYFLRSWDPQYTPLLQSGDPGEDPLKGGLVVARHGKGTYVYTGYVFFRQLPAGVKGAYRVFANLVSLD